MADPGTAVLKFPLSSGDTVSEALKTSSQALGVSRSVLKSLLNLRDCQQQPLSHSVSDAQALVQAREDEKKKQQAKKDKSKSSTPTPAADTCPGAEQGAESTKSAYWLYMEAYFRDVTQEDLHVLLPAFDDPLQDPAYAVPAIGSHFSAEDLILSPRATRGLKAVNASHSSRSIPMMSLLGSATTTGPQALADADMSMRRRARQIPRQPSRFQAQSLEAQAQAAATAAQQAADDAAADRAEDDSSIQSLLEAWTQQDLHALVKQVAELQGTTGPTLHPAAQETPATLSSTDAASGSALDEVQQWLRQQADALAIDAHLPPVHNVSSSQLDFLPGFMTKAAAQAAAGAEIDAAAAPTLLAASNQLQKSASQEHSRTMRDNDIGGDEASAQAGPVGDTGLDSTGSAANKQPAGDSEKAGVATPRTWLEWEQQIQNESPGDSWPHMADECMHPHTQWVLRQPLAEYVLNPHPVYLRYGRATASGAAAAASGAVSGSPSGHSGGTTAQGAEADTATQRDQSPDAAALSTPATGSVAAINQAELVQQPTQQQQQQQGSKAVQGPANGPSGTENATAVGQADAEQVAPALSGFSASKTPENPAGSEPYTPAGNTASQQWLDRQNSNAAAGPSKGSSRPLGRQRSSINYSLLAGNRKPEAKGSGSLPKPAKKAAHKHSPAPQADVRKDQAALAVAAAIAAGPPELSIEDEWLKLQEHPDVLATAPDDEVLAELLALQAELLQQEIINRQRMSVAVQRLVEDLPKQQAAADNRMLMAEYVKGYQLKMRAIKRSKTRDKKEQAHREAIRAAHHSAQAKEAPRTAAGRIPGAFVGESISKAYQGPFMTGELKDVLAGRTEDEEALCAVCSGGLSVAPNLIVFCERCDIAVHQKCYGIDDIPTGEWLCWPCKVHEEEQRQQGVPQAKIRPPRWEVQGGQLEGGSKAAQCALCPVRQGAFRRTADGKAWMHEVDALWQPELSVLPGNICNAFQGLGDISADRLGVMCCVCGRSSDGAVIRCSHSHCSVTFHPLCGRNNGQYLAIRQAGNKVSYKAFCANHSQQARAKDRDLGLGVEVVGMPAKEGRQQKEKGMSQEALQGLVVREGQQRQLAAIRLELERLRLLLERVSKRERLKRDIIRTTTELQQAQLADPVAAIHHQHQLANPSLAPFQPQPSSEPQTQQPHQQPLQHSMQGPTDEAEQGADNADAPGSSAAHSKPASFGWGRLKKVKLAAPAETSQDVGSKRKRDQDTDDQEEVASRNNKKKKAGSRSKSGQVKVDKERLMTSTEAAATNEKLPKGFMYVPAHRLNSGTISGNE